ncbi:MAG: DUF1778 domain-containing protein [Bacteroidota bacterium]
MAKVEKARFNARLTQEQKELFEYATQLGGFRSLTEFVIQSAQIKAKEIVKEHNQILATQEDQNLFFDAIMNPAEPNSALQEALEAYNQALGK